MDFKDEDEQHNDEGITISIVRQVYTSRTRPTARFYRVVLVARDPIAPSSIARNLILLFTREHRATAVFVLVTAVASTLHDNTIDRIRNGDNENCSDDEVRRVAEIHEFTHQPLQRHYLRSKDACNG